MKKGLFLIIITALLCIPSKNTAQSVGVSNLAITPDISSMFEVRATNFGILIPRVALTATNTAGPITSPATSLLVYNNATVGSGTSTGVYPGYYYNAGTPAAPNWKRLAEGTGSGDAWLTTGNFGTVPANNWLGTNDVQDFVMRANNIERMRIASGGNVLVNTNTALDATDALEVIVSPTFTTGLGSYGNGGYPIWGEQLSGAAHAIYAINSTATGAGAGAGLYAYSEQTGSAAIWGSGNTTTRGVIGTNDNATYAAVQGQNDNADGDGVYGINNAATGAGIGTGVFGYSEQTGAAGVWGYGSTNTRGVLGTTTHADYAGVHAQNGSSSGEAIYAVNSAANGTANGKAIDARSGQTGGATIIAMMQSTSYYSNSVLSAYNASTLNTSKGVIAAVTHRDGIAIYGYNNAGASTGSGNGVYGVTLQSQGFGIEGSNANTSGTGILGVGNNQGGLYLTNGSGGSFVGEPTGSFNYATDASGTGVIGVGNGGANIQTLVSGSGGAFTGQTTGIYGVSVGTSYLSSGGYFEQGTGGIVYSYIATSNGPPPTNYGILSNGTKSTVVKDLNNEPVTMFCTEAPEVLFQDFGTGEIVNGKAHINIDPIFSKNIYTDDKHPIKVFIQLEGECNGVYVSNKTINGFDVIELNNGTSNTPFSYTIVANRIDDINDDGSINSVYSTIRFPKAPDFIPRDKEEVQSVPTIELPKEQKAGSQDEINISPEIKEKIIKGTSVDQKNIKTKK